VALQLDGPAQFFSNAPHLPLGDTLLEWRLLLSTNWKVRRRKQLSNKQQ